MTTEAPMRPRNILQLSTDEKLKFLNSFDYVFSDIDGVVWNIDQGIDGSSEGFQELKNAGKKLTFITNNSVRPAHNYVKKFKELNMEVDMDELVHPAKSVVDYLKSINFDGLIYVIATETFKDVLRISGFKLIDGPNEILEESFTAVAKKIFDREPVRAVVIDLDFNMSATKLLRAHVYLNNPECLLIAGATDMLLSVRKDINILGPGPFIKVLDDATKQRMITLGKPGKDLAQMLLKRYDIKDTKRALMIGDMLEQDVGFGKQCGFQTLAVLCGGTSHEDLTAETNPDLLPDYYAESMFDFVEFMRDLKKSNV